MKLYELEPMTAEIRHPNDADLCFVVIEPDVLDTLAHTEKLTENATTTVKFQAAVEFLAQHTKEVFGLVDRSGARVVLEAPIEPSALMPFFRPVYNCTYRKPGEDEQTTEAWANYVIARLMDRETFSRPLEPGTSTAISS
jgi:hypothetical protein